MNTEPIRTCPKCQAPVPADAPQGLCPKCLLAAVSIATEAAHNPAPHIIPPLEKLADLFPQLEILEFIGQGGMGLVYRARQRQLDRVVALKLLPQKTGTDPTFGERFTREARVLARLSHPNIVAVFDFGRVEGFCYLTMEFVDGVNLRQAMRAGRFTPSQALALVPKICDALQYAHEEGVLHRDIKPENLLLDTRGRVKIADFGIAKLLGENADLGLTASGAAIGTPHYMAPEQLEHPHDVDQRADIFSLGVVFYEMLTGELPIGRFAPPSEKAEVDARIDQIVFRTLEKERERRFQSAGEVKTRVEHVTANPAQADVGSSGVQNPKTLSSTGSPPGAPPPESSGRGSLAQQSGRRRVSIVLVGSSLAALLMALFIMAAGHVPPGAAVILLMIVAIPATLGTLLGWSALRNSRRSNADSKSLWVARISALTWPLILCDAALFFALVLSARNLEVHLFRMNNPALTMLAAIVGVVGIAALNWSLGREWVKRWQNEPFAIPFEGSLNRPGRFRRSKVLVSGFVGVFIFFALLRGAFHEQSRFEPVPVVQTAQPTPPRGYAIPMGSVLGNDWTYHAGLSVPAGYVLSLTVTLWSNQVPVKPGTPSSAFIIAPPGNSIPGHVTWRLLGNGALADGAPLEFSIGLDQGPEETKIFHVVTPQTVAVDWVGQPSQVWPPSEGHTRFLIVKGNGTGGPASLPPSPQDSQIPLATPDTQLSGSAESESGAEWAVGIEARLDPIPSDSLHKLDKPQVGLGSKWTSIFDSGAGSPAEAEALKPESQSSNP